LRPEPFDEFGFPDQFDEFRRNRYADPDEIVWTPKLQVLMTGNPLPMLAHVLPLRKEARFVSPAVSWVERNRVQPIR
jgi:hypothetical protein